MHIYFTRLANKLSNLIPPMICPILHWDYWFAWNNNCIIIHHIKFSMNITDLLLHFTLSLITDFPLIILVEVRWTERTLFNFCFDYLILLMVRSTLGCDGINDHRSMFSLKSRWESMATDRFRWIAPTDFKFKTFKLRTFKFTTGFLVFLGFWYFLFLGFFGLFFGIFM